jgi:cobalt-zinc-cadmium efflux system membrane fusion protein
MKFRKLLILGYVSVLSFIAIQCEDNHSMEDVEHDEAHEETGLIELSEEEIAEFDITIGIAKAGKLKVHITVPGEIVIPPDNLAHIHPRFPGMVKEVRKHIGDYVREGEILAIMESNESLTEYQIKSLIDGTIIEKHITRGEVVEADNNQHGFVVANLNEVWVYLNIYQKDLSFVKKGQRVTISLGPGLKEVAGRINYISPIIDEITRTAAARVILSNPNGTWKPGLFVVGTIVTDEFNAKIAVPKTAIESIDNQPCLFVKSSDGFEARFITLGRKSQMLVEVRDGLSKGETYVTKGGFTLKAELEKEFFGDSHGH